MTNDDTTRSKRLYCNRCRSENNHLPKASHSRTDTYPEDYWETVTYTLLTCGGCDTGVLEVSKTGAGWESEGEQHFTYAYHPPRASADHHKKTFRKLTKPLRTIYRETVDAYNGGLNILCAGGLRALIEGICSDKKIRGQNLEEKVDKLEEILPKNLVQHLHAFRFIGNEALHELGVPERETLRMAIDVSEDLLNFLYDLDYKASRLSKLKIAATGGSA
jgi:hypothetical protein